jgi:hypothetical protein
MLSLNRPQTTTVLSNTHLYCVRLNKCGLFNGKHNGIAYIKTAVSKHLSVLGIFCFWWSAGQRF